MTLEALKDISKEPLATFVPTPGKISICPLEPVNSLSSPILSDETKDVSPHVPPVSSPTISPRKRSSLVTISLSWHSSPPEPRKILEKLAEVEGSEPVHPLKPVDESLSDSKGYALRSRVSLKDKNSSLGGIALEHPLPIQPCRHEVSPIQGTIEGCVG